MPTEEVSDLREVVDAINKLCETMKSSYDEPVYEDCEEVLVQEADSGLVSPAEVVVRRVETQFAERWSEPPIVEESVRSEETDVMEECKELVSSEKSEIFDGNDALVEAESLVESFTIHKSEPIEMTAAFEESNASIESVELNKTKSLEDTVALEDSNVLYESAITEPFTLEELAAAPLEPTSEMYYTASSEVSLLSDTDILDKVNNEDSDKEKDDRNIMAGHVAAMRERFESMTRANTPCPELGRSLSPSLDVFRNITPSPDLLDKS